MCKDAALTLVIFTSIVRDIFIYDEKWTAIRKSDIVVDYHYYLEPSIVDEEL